MLKLPRLEDQADDLLVRLGYERNQKLTALTKNLPRKRLLVLVLGLRTFQIPGRYSVIGFTSLDIIG